MKKIEIIARVTKEDKEVEEQSLMCWSDIEYLEEQGSKAQILYFPGLEIRLSQKRVLRNGKDIHLSRYEYGVLVFLAQHHGTLFDKEQIFEAIWDEDSESCLSAITNTISRIRQKIEDDKNNPFYIRTVSNLGYIFVPEPICVERPY